MSTYTLARVPDCSETFELVALVREWADARNNWVSYDGKSGDRVMKAEAALLAYRRHRA